MHAPDTHYTMAGDVFGNGMLLSDHIKLLAAFNHMHIFLDPNPDPKISFEERQRLFNLPRSAWTDYNPELISKGGGVFRRTDKSIKLSPEVKSALAIQVDFLAPNELITAILQALWILLWNGALALMSKPLPNKILKSVTVPMILCASMVTNCVARVSGEGGNLGMNNWGVSNIH